MKEYKLNKENYYLKIYNNTNCESPDDWGNTNIFLVFEHRSFTIERKEFAPRNIYEYLQQCNNPETIDLRNDDYDKYWIFPLYAFIHSGVTLSITNNTYPFNDRWDVSTTGFVLIEKENYIENKKSIIVTKKEAEKYAEGLIHTWNDYLSGNVHSFDIIHKAKCEHCGNIEEENIDSYDGFYGNIDNDLIQNMLSHTEFKLA